MDDTNDELSYEEQVKLMSKLAEVTVLLLIERPIGTTNFEPDREISLGIPKELYSTAVQMKNSITNLFGTLAHSLIESDYHAPRMFVNETGAVDPQIMNAISFRFNLYMGFPEFSLPLGEEFKKAAVLKSVAGVCWRLVDGEGKTVCLQAIGEKTPRPKRIPRTRATVIRMLADDKS